MKTKEKNGICKQIENYFVGVKHHVQMGMFGGCVHVDIAYEDFKPSEQVRSDLMGISPNIRVGQLERTFSSYAMRNAIDLMATQWMEHRCANGGIPDYYPTL